MSSQFSRQATYLPQARVFETDKQGIFKVQMEKAWIDIALRVNERVIGGYYTNEQLTGKEYFGSDNQRRRQTYRKVIDLGTLSTGANSIAHGISFPSPNTYRIVSYEGGLWDLTAVTYASVLNNSITVTVDATNVNINIPGAYNGYEGYITLEYLKF